MTDCRQRITDLLRQTRELANELNLELDSDPEFRNHIVEQSKKITRTLQTPIDQAWEIFFQPHHLSVLRSALDAGWLQSIADAGDDGVSVDHLASTSRADASLVRRLMRVLVASGSVREVSHDVYAPAEVSTLFTNPKWAAGLRHASHDYAVSISRMPEYFSENGFEMKNDVEKGIYAYARGMPFLKYMSQTPAVAEQFNIFMSATRAGKTFWADVFPIEKLEVAADKDALLVDVGGGKGHELADFLERQKRIGLKGRLILQELPRVTAQISDNSKMLFDIQEHDFFLPQKEVNARVYYVSNVLHGWSNENCVAILTHIKNAMKPGYSTLLLNEIVLPDMGCSFRGAAFDVTMMAMVSGRNRTKQEWEEMIGLVTALKIDKFWSLGLHGDSIIEITRTK